MATDVDVDMAIDMDDDMAANMDDDGRWIYRPISNVAQIF
jgi:hypothetical protein